MKDRKEEDDFKCHICGRDGYKTDGESKVWCEECLGIATCIVPIKRDGPKINRNDPCLCGSKKKFKKCCGTK